MKSTIAYAVFIVSLIFIYSSSAGVLESNNHKRPPRSLGMNFGHAGNMGPGGFNNAGPNNGLRNPERPQMESIYRGKVMWGNGTEGKPDNQYVFGTGRLADEETDKFGNPIRQPKRGPRPQIKPHRKEENEKRKRRAVNQRIKEESHQERADHNGLSEVDEVPFEIRLLGEQIEGHQKGAPEHNIKPLGNNIVNDGPDTIGHVLRAEKKPKAGPKPNLNFPRQEIQNKEPYSSSYSIEPRHDFMNEGPDTIGDTRSVGDILRNEKVYMKHKAAPKSNINPQRNNAPDTVGDTRILGDILKAEKIPEQVVNEDNKNIGDILKPRVVNTINKSPVEKEASHNIQKRDINYFPNEAIEAVYKGPVLESRYKGPVIESRYRGPQIRSEFTAQILSQYMGPQIISEYKGKVISMLGGVQAYEKMVAQRAAAEASTSAIINMAQKYNQMNQELEKEKILNYVRRKPKLKEIFSEP